MYKKGLKEVYFNCFAGEIITRIKGFHSCLAQSNMVQCTSVFFRNFSLFRKNKKSYFRKSRKFTVQFLIFNCVKTLILRQKVSVFKACVF